MPRVRNPNRNRAYEIYKEKGGNITNKELANLLGEKEKTISNWKSVDKWNVVNKLNDCSNTKNTTKKRGAPKGSKNAIGNKGGAAPLGNKNNYKHGIYEKLLFSSLTEDEQELIIDDNIYEIEELKRTIRFCDLQIVRFMKKIKEAEEVHGGLIIGSVTLVKDEEKDEQKSTYAIGAYEVVLKYNNEIEKAKAKKIRCLEALIKLSANNERLELERQKLELSRDKIKAENEVKEDSQNINVQIYIPENNRK